MQIFSRRAAGLLAMAGVLWLQAGSVQAQTWPSKPIRIVVGFGAGGTADVLARLLQPELASALQAQVVVENRPGSSGAIGSAAVVASEADGHTLLIGGAGPHLLAPAVNPNVKYVTMRDFTHIAMIAGDSFMLAAAPNLGVKTLAELIKLGSERDLGCASPGAGSQGHLLQELIKRSTKIRLNPVPYRGGGEAMADLTAGHIPLALQPVINVGEQVLGGRAIGLAVASPQRIPRYKDVPTFAELGFPEIRGTSWFWLTGPANMPQPIVARLNAEVRRIVKLPAVSAKFSESALQTADLDPGALNSFLAEEVRVWGDLARETGFKMQ